MSISPVTKEQWAKVAKAVGYSFVSTFVATLLIVPDLNSLDQRALLAAVVAGVNASLVTIKQLVTEA